MGQSQGANPVKDQKKGRGKSNKSRSDSKLVAPKKAFTLENILTPNGMYPPEILELIMIHMDILTMLSSSLSCKLWLETSYQAAKRLYRQEFDSTIDDSINMDYREVYLKLCKAKSNLIKGLYWTEVLCSQYRTPGNGDVSYSFTSRNNDIVYSSYTSQYDSYRSTTFNKVAVKYNLETNERSSHEFNCLYVGETEMYYDVSFDGLSVVKVLEVNPIGQPKRRVTIKLDIVEGRYMIAMFKNLDGTNQLLIKYNDNSFDVFDTMTGKHIINQKFPSKPNKNIRSFYKNYIACYVDGPLLEIIDVNTKETKYSFVLPTNFVEAHMFNDKLAFACHDTVMLFDLEKGKVLKEFTIDTSDLDNGDDDIDRVLAISFDKWKLVVALVIQYNYHVVQIYDMNDDFKLLQTIHDPMSIRQKTRLELLPNGSIVVSDINLTVYHFDHPSLYEKITVGFYDDDLGRISLYKINAVDITKVALEMLNITLEQISAVTINKQINPESPFVKRMTCIFEEHQEFQRVGFMSAFEGWPNSSNLTVPFAFTNDKMINTMALKNAAPYGVYRPPGFIGSCLIVFEEDVDADNCWKFCKPEFDDDLEIFRPAVKKISVDYTEIYYYAEKKK